MTRTIFLLEDSQSLGESLSSRLTQEGYQIRWAKSLAEGREIFQSGRVDLAIVDVSLPDGSGFEFVRNHVAGSNIPVVFLTAFSSAEYRLEGFELDAADYIPKPFHLRELLLRIGRVLDRTQRQSSLSSGGFTLHLESLSITDSESKTSFLAKREFELLENLIRQSPRIVSRNEILDAWGNPEGVNLRSVDNSVVRLRQALGAAGERCLRSVRGVGYQWVVGEGETKE